MSGSFLGVDIGGSQTKLALLAASGETQTLPGMPTLAEDGPRAHFQALRAHLDAHLPGAPVSGAGLSVAGLMTRQERLVEAPNLHSFVGGDLRLEWDACVELALLRVENDVQCAIYGEWVEGAARGSAYAAMLSLGTGVGGGVIADGRLYRGARGLGGELGHIILDPSGPLCACGGAGHVESYLSSAAIVAAAADFLEDGAGLTVEEISRRAHAGDAGARALLRDRGFYLGLACASLAHTLNPSRIVIGGGVAGCGEHLLEPARETLRERAMDSCLTGLDVVVAGLGPFSAAIGAAHLAKDAR